MRSRFRVGTTKALALLSFVGGSDGTQALKGFRAVDGTKTKFMLIKELPDALVLCAGGQLGERDIIVGGTRDAADIAGCKRRSHERLTFVIAGRTRGTRSLLSGQAICTAASAVAVGG